MTAFTKAFLLDTLEDGSDVVENAVVGKSRWANNHRMTFRVGDRFYQTTYRQGTGDEGESPWEHVADDTEIECCEAFPVEKTVITYEVKA